MEKIERKQQVKNIIYIIKHNLAKNDDETEQFNNENQQISLICFISYRSETPTHG
ncbi:hypothetical protein MHB42_16295 [Lysinibacillus sp. FSL K6-0232]|uniref:hypothetical protein n=1 Tax=unclassified Lysinibacillus TaxID=2636778 RepID=UPI0030FD0235